MAGRKETIKATIRRFIAPGKMAAANPVGFSGSAPDAKKSSYNGSQAIYHILAIAGLGVVYFVAAKLGLKLAFLYPSASSVWPGTGIALAAMLLFGYRVWPAIFVGAFVANLTTAGSVATSLGIATGNTLEGLIGARFLNRCANGRKVFDRARDILKFAFLAATLSTVISATIGVTSLSIGKFIQPKDFGRVWFIWWLGDVLDGEIRRADRTDRPFAILFVDVDTLKLINDNLGHIAGNQALCRVANALRGSCRSIDTVARFGGDEFAMILPEAEETAAHIVAERIANRLAHDRDGPTITVSVGVAVYPTNGNRKESLMNAADNELYKAKAAAVRT